MAYLVALIASAAFLAFVSAHATRRARREPDEKVCRPGQRCDDCLDGGYR